MSQDLTGNLKGLSPSQLDSVHRMFRRRVQKDEIISIDLARELYRVASTIRRKIGLFITREGEVVEICVGTRDRIYLPDLGRYRFGHGRLRRLRLIFSDLSADVGEDPSIPSDIYGDLEKLRLDAVVGVVDHRNNIKITFAHLLPTSIKGSDERGVDTQQGINLGRLELDFARFIDDIEGEIATSTAKARKTGLTRAIAVGVYSTGTAAAESSMRELLELARTAGVEIAETVVQRRTPDPKTVLGKGRLEDVVLRCLRLDADMIIFDRELTPSQWRAITNSTELKVIDRSMLILDIFAQRAKSSEGRVQVELAQLKYNLPRLAEKDSGLSRLTGGIGGRGPGETKMEIGKRRIRDRIAMLEGRIKAISKQRALRGERRKEGQIPLVSILGYTNAGKSTLFNVLTKSTVLAQDKLFATLDPTQRQLCLDPGGEDSPHTPRVVILSDTVGFIRELPKELVSAFKATLDELHNAQLLLHVLDASDVEAFHKKEAVDRTVRELGLTNTKTLVVLNKSDATEPGQLETLIAETQGIAVSSIKKEGLEVLKDKITEALDELVVQGRLADG